MPNLTKFVCLTTIVLSFNSIAVHAEEVKSKAGDDNIYAFANYGIAKHNAGVNATAASGSLSISTTSDDEGTAVTLGIGWQKNDHLSFEVYAGKVDGFGATTTVTATNASAWGYTINGSLSLNEDISTDLIGANMIFGDTARFSKGGSLSYFGKLGLVNYKIKDKVSLSGSGTINGTSYNISSPALITLEKDGTGASLGAGVAYTTADNLELSFGVDYIPNVGGGDLVEADITVYNLGLAVKF